MRQKAEMLYEAIIITKTMHRSHLMANDAVKFVYSYEQSVLRRD